MEEVNQKQSELFVKKDEKGESYNFSDQELIKQLVKSRTAQGKELEYEDLTGYELPPRTQFSMLSKPALSIKYGQMTFNTACVRLFADALYILTPVHRDKKRLMVVPCNEEESASLQWARYRASDNMKVTRSISSEEFVLKLYKMMGWNLNCRYKIMGRVAIAKPGPMPVLIFDLEEAIMFDSKPVEIYNEETGETKKKQIKYYPEEYKDCIGKSYNDYITGKQMNLFEFLEEYTGQSYSDFLDKSEEAKKDETETVGSITETDESTNSEIASSVETMKTGDAGNTWGINNG